MVPFAIDIPAGKTLTYVWGAGTSILTFSPLFSKFRNRVSVEYFLIF